MMTPPPAHRVQLEPAHRGRVPVLGLQPPDEPGRPVRGRVHRIQGAAKSAISGLSIGASSRPILTCAST